MNSRFKEIRKFLKMSQEDFGKKLGVSNTAISKIEKGENNLTEQMINLTCRTFNVDETWLRTGEGKMTIQTDNQFIDAVAEKYNLDAFGREFIKIFISLTAEQQDLIKQAAFSLLDSVQKNEHLLSEFKQYQADKNSETTKEPAYGSEEWAEKQAILYKQELLAEAKEQMSSVSQDAKDA